MAPARRRRRPERRKSGDYFPPVESAPIPADIPERESWTYQFGTARCSDRVGSVLEGLGFVAPTPVQAAAIPEMLDGRDVVGQAKTGTGKTLAFGIPIVELLNPHSALTQAAIVLPTRELAIQVGEALRPICDARSLRLAVVYGGDPLEQQFAQLARGAQIVVGTPGRMMDHLRRGTLSLEAVEIVVLDEADEMLDIGFADDIDWILRHTPSSRQTALYSATIPGPIKAMIYKYLRNPVWVRLSSDLETVPETDQVFFEVLEEDKPDALGALLEEYQVGRALVFRRTQRGVDALERELLRRGVQAQAIHGGMSQRVRNSVMGAFRAGTLRVLVATNVAARGLDISDVTHVVNYDVPDNAEEYVHRIGRTGRAGRSGMALTLVGEWDLDLFDRMRAQVGGQIRQETLSIYQSLRHP